MEIQTEQQKNTDWMKIHKIKKANGKNAEENFSQITERIKNIKFKRSCDTFVPRLFFLFSFSFSIPFDGMALTCDLQYISFDYFECRSLAQCTQYWFSIMHSTIIDSCCCLIFIVNYPVKSRKSPESLCLRAVQPNLSLSLLSYCLPPQLPVITWSSKVICIWYEHSSAKSP